MNHNTMRGIGDWTLPQKLSDLNNRHLKRARRATGSKFTQPGMRTRTLFNDLVMVYKCMNNLTPHYLRERFNQRSEIHQRYQAKERAYIAQVQAYDWAKGFCLPWGQNFSFFT